MTGDMDKRFRDAFLWHLENNSASMAELSRGSGVSIDVLKKLKNRPTASTDTENAVRIAAFYGKTVNQFVALEDTDETTEFNVLIGLATDEEKRVLLAQLRGMVVARAQK